MRPHAEPLAPYDNAGHAYPAGDFVLETPLREVFGAEYNFSGLNLVPVFTPYDFHFLGIGVRIVARDFRAKLRKSFGAQIPAGGVFLRIVEKSPEPFTGVILHE